VEKAIDTQVVEGADKQKHPTNDNKNHDFQPSFIKEER